MRALWICLLFSALASTSLTLENWLELHGTGRFTMTENMNNTAGVDSDKGWISLELIFRTKD